MNERKFDSSMPIEELIKAMGWNDPEEEEETKNAPVRFEEKEEGIPKNAPGRFGEDTYINQELIVENLGHDMYMEDVEYLGHDMYMEDGESSWEEIKTACAGVVRKADILTVKAAQLGAMLNIKKLTTPRGEFEELVEQYCDIGLRQLQNYMLIATLRPDLVNYDPLSGLPVPPIHELLRIGHNEQELKKKLTKGRTKAEDAERKQKERAYKSSLKAIGNYNYNECIAVVEEAQKRISQLRPQGYQNPPQNTGKQTVTIDANNVQPKKQTVTIDANNVHYFK